jgi:hypothetical protein
VRIKLHDLFCTDTLRHRETARKIVEIIPKDISQVIVDFEEIDFASRSFLHELLVGLDNKEVSYENANQEILLMTKAILRTFKSGSHTEEDGKLVIA